MATTKEATKVAQDQQSVLDFFNELLLGKAPGQGEPSPGILELIPGLAAMPGASKPIVKGYREFRRQLAREPGTRFSGDLAPAVADLVNKLLKGPMFHGSTRSGSRLLEEGFDPNKIGTKYGLRFGEPSGVSLTLSPATAQGFGSPLRVAPTIKPRDIAPVFSDRAREAILESYQNARSSHLVDVTDNLFKSPLRSDVLLSTDPYYANLGKKTREFLSREKGSVPMDYLLAIIKDADIAIRRDLYKLYGSKSPPYPSFYSNVNALLSPDVIKKFNENISQRLRQKHEIEALLYNPNRYREIEMRVLNPRNIVPLEWRTTSKFPYETEIPERYISRKEKIIRDFLQSLKGEPESLSEYYKQLPE